MAPFPADPNICRFWEFSSLIKKPLDLVLSVVLIWKLIGWPCLFGVLVVLLAQGFNVLITTKILLRWERRRRTATDSKLQKITEYVGTIRHLRWYGWQDFWQEKIMQARQSELNLRIITSLCGILIGFTNNLASGMFPVAAFYAYTVLAGQSLRVDIAFPALQLFSILESNLREVPSLITVLLNARIAVDRIEDFMKEPNKDLVIPHTEQGDRKDLELRNASFAWPGTGRPVLHEISIAFPVGLTVITGKVGAGKTALLQALMGELDKLAGSVIQSNEMIGYCGQRAWLQSMSIKENILFSSLECENVRYKQVLQACALTQDLAFFKDGDLSNIGENGTGLSGGQKARVALARAVYSQARILLLDDPLSALDHQTAETIVRNCLGGPLLKDRVVILVTHRTDLCHGIIRQLVEISEGRARVLQGVEFKGSSMLSMSRSSDSVNGRNGKDSKEEKSTPDKFIEEEHRAHGGVKVAVYWEYIKAGKIKWWVVLISILALYRLITVGETWFLKSWSEAFERNQSESGRRGLLDKLPSPGTDVGPWLMGFFLIAAVRSCMFLISESFMLVITYSAGRSMFREIMQKVSHATFRFYDITPGTYFGVLVTYLGLDLEH